MTMKGIAKAIAKILNEFGGATEEQKQKLSEIKEEYAQEKKNTEKKVDQLMESFDYLRICVKYTVYDLECSRREVAQLKKDIAKLEEGT